MESIYERDGYQLIEGAISQADLQPLRNDINEQITLHARELVNQGKATDLYLNLPFGKRLVALHQEAPLTKRSWPTTAFNPSLYPLINHPAIIDAVEAHVGPDITFVDYLVRPKMPRSESTAFPLHQDSQYYGKASQHAHTVTVWIPLVDVNEENGCLFVIPGSHKWELYDSARDENSNMRSFVDVEARGTPIPIPMKAGDILLFHNMTFHGSKVNHTDGVRWSVDIRYVRTLGTQATSSTEQAGVEFMFEKMRNVSLHAAMVVRGDGPRWSLEDWQRETESKRAARGTST